MAACYTSGKLIDDALRKLATQYRESPKMKAFITVFLAELEAIQKAMCDSIVFDLDRLGAVINFPRCWCNIKRRKWFGFSRPPVKYFGFDYDISETEVVPAACLVGFDAGVWLEVGDNPDCSIASIQNCCSSGDPTVQGFCDADFICEDYPQHVDHCFNDDTEYAMLLRAKMVSNSSSGKVTDILNVAQILYGAQTTLFYDNHGGIWLSVNRLLTDNEIFLIDFYKTLIPVSPGISITIVNGLNKQFGFTTSTCLQETIGGLCDGILTKRY